MKKSVVVVLIAVVFLTSMVGSATASTEVTLQGFLVAEQLVGKPTEFYLRDNKDDMISLKFPKGVRADILDYAGKKVEVKGVLEGKKLTVSELTPLEEPSPKVPVIGPQDTIVIMAYFTDRTNTELQGEVYRMVFNDMNGYYMEASYGLMEVVGGFNPWVQLDHTVAYYGSNDNNNWWFIRDAVAKVDSVVNFALYTKFLFVNAGPNEETSGIASDIWSCRWHGLSIATNDGVTITHGAIVPDIEKSPYGALGVTAHEYGHELGLPDLYGYAGGVVKWDGMAEGVWNNAGNTPASFTSYCRNLQGWIASSKIRTISLRTAELLLLDPLEDATGTVLAIRMDDGANYYLIEARRKVGFDAYLPGEKVLVLYYESGTGKVYLRATLGAGQSYRSGNVEVMVIKEDLEKWAFQMYVSYKSWSSDTRLTNNPANSFTNWRGRAVASVGEYVYVVWEDVRDGNWEIYFKRSTDVGLSWGSDTRLTSQSASSSHASVAAYGSYVYVVWEDYRDGNWEIYLLRNEKYGTDGFWYGGQRLTANAAHSYAPIVAAYYRNVHVVWMDDRDGKFEIYYKRSQDNGLNWGPDTRLSANDGYDSQYACVAAYSNYVYVAWEDNRTANWDIFVKQSTDSGATWGADKQLTTNTLDQRYPSIAADGYDVHVVWTDYRTTGNTEIYYRRSIDKGTTYKGEVKLTKKTGESQYASVAVQGRTVYVVWEDTRIGTYEIWFKDSPDRGSHWTEDRSLSKLYDAMSRTPSVSVARDNVYVAWTDYRDGNAEIYFKYRW